MLLGSLQQPRPPALDAIATPTPVDAQNSLQAAGASRWGRGLGGGNAPS